MSYQLELIIYKSFINRVFFVMITFICLVSCGQVQDDGLGPATNTGLFNPETSERKLDVEIELNLGQDHILLKKDIFSLFDVFFKSFIVPIKNNLETVDTYIDFESMHVLRKRKDLEYLKLVSAIETLISNKEVLDKRSLSYKLSFYINSYNYHLIRLINKNYLKDGKVINTIKQLSNQNNSLDIFDRRFILIEGERLSLNQLLKSKIFKLIKNADARVLFSLTSASVSSPFILNNSIRPDNLEYMLEELSSRNIMLPRIFKYHKNDDQNFVSQIFHWHKTIFEWDQNGGILGYLKNYLPTGSKFSTTFKYLDYDWRLKKNQIATRAVPRIINLHLLPEAREIDLPTTPDDSGDISDDDIILRMKPCRRYQTNPMIDIIARCEEVIEGNVEKAKRTIVKADICILEQELLESKGKIRTIAGSLWDKKRKQNDDAISQFDLFISEKSISESYGFSMISKTKYKNFITFNPNELELSIKQNIRYIAIKNRSVNLQCIGFF
jgi:hypothetical protein